MERRESYLPSHLRTRWLPIRDSRHDSYRPVPDNSFQTPIEHPSRYYDSWSLSDSGYASRNAKGSGSNSVRSGYSQHHCSPPFEYVPLLAGDAIRLLRIHPGYYDDPISCSIFQIHPRQAEDYPWVAISYAWGRPRPCRQIELNGSPFQTTAASYEVLQNVRDEQKDRIIWIDAICINQKDNAEKGHQVQRMSMIYREAIRVLVWLGIPDSDVREACIFLNQIERRLSSGKLNARSSAEDLYKSTRSSRNSRRWPQLLKFFFLPWFSRLWVVQEVVLARKTVFRCGDIQIGWKTLAFITDMLKSGIAYSLPTDAEAIYSCLSFEELQHMCYNYEGAVKGRHRISLPYLVYKCGRKDCTDPRDQIYGVLGLFDYKTHGGAPKLPIDYGQSPEEVFIQATRWTITDQQTLEILSLVGSANIHNSPLDIPTWVPDYSRLEFKIPFGITGNREFCAGGRADGTFKRQFSFERDGRIFVLKALVVDKIKEVGCCCTLQVSDLDPDEFGLVRWCKQAMKMFKKTGPAVEDHFLRTLQADQIETIPDTSEHMNHQQRLEVVDLLHHAVQYPSFSPRQRLHLRKFISNLFDVTDHRRFAVLKSGDIGLVLRNVQVGDLVCVAPGAYVPLVIRPTRAYGKLCYKFLGEAYVDGLMHGEGMELEKKPRLQTIRLV